MIPIIKRLESIDFGNPITAIKQLAEHIRDLENQIEDLLIRIDNVNLLPLDLDDMELYTDNGSKISGDKIKIKGPEGQVFEVGWDKQSKKWIFEMPQIAELSVKTITADTINADTITRGGETL